MMDAPYIADDYYLECERDEARREQAEKRWQRQIEDEKHDV